jgi:hypothetical protein
VDSEGGEAVNVYEAVQVMQRGGKVSHADLDGWFVLNTRGNRKITLTFYSHGEVSHACSWLHGDELVRTDWFEVK